MPGFLRLHFIAKAKYIFNFYNIYKLIISTCPLGCIYSFPSVNCLLCKWCELEPSALHADEKQCCLSDIINLEVKTL